MENSYIIIVVMIYATFMIRISTVLQIKNTYPPRLQYMIDKWSDAVYDSNRVHKNTK